MVQAKIVKCRNHDEPGWYMTTIEGIASVSKVIEEFRFNWLKNIEFK